jgi:hypothetical protein
MIAARFIEQIRKQQWMGVSIELVIVVLGVFIGMQVNNWNEARKDRNLARSYIGRIHDDIRGDLKRFDRGDVAADMRIAQVGVLLHAVSAPESVNKAPARFLMAMEKAAWRTYEPVEPRAYAELVSTGKMNLVTPIALRDAIAAYYAQIERWAPIASDQRAQDAFVRASAGLLDAHQIDAVERSEGATNVDWTDDDLSTAVDIARRLAATPAAVRWLPELHHHQIVVKAVDARNRASANALLTEIEADYPTLKTDESP